MRFGPGWGCAAAGLCIKVAKHGFFSWFTAWISFFTVAPVTSKRKHHDAEKHCQNALSETASRSSAPTGPAHVACPSLTAAHHKISDLNGSSEKNPTGMSHRAPHFVSVAIHPFGKLLMIEKYRPKTIAALARATAVCLGANQLWSRSIFQNAPLPRTLGNRSDGDCR